MIRFRIVQTIDDLEDFLKIPVYLLLLSVYCLFVCLFLWLLNHALEKLCVHPLLKQFMRNNGVMYGLMEIIFHIMAI